MTLSAALQLGPNSDAFLGGVGIGLGVAFIVMAALGGLAIFRRIVGA